MTEQLKNAIQRHDLRMCFFCAFTQNGWEDVRAENDDVSTYKLLITSIYNDYVYAKVSRNENGLNAYGDYGVVWLEVEYEYNDKPLCSGDIQNILEDMETAEENLLMLGIPFTTDYQFHGRNRANKVRRNAKNRKIWGLKQ